LLALIAFFFYGLYRYRIMQFREQQKLRREIANDLHDDLGSTLTTVKVLAEIARRSPEKDEHLDQIENTLIIASAGLKDLIWVLDDARDSLKDFMERVKNFILPIATAKGICINMTIEEALYDHTLTKSEKRNLLMIVKETVNNSIKYADCRFIHLQVGSSEKKCTIRIVDDGKGFDPGIVSDGNGLKNIRYRARQIQYSVSISSSLGQGTTIELRQE
jgi:signal transduction histidine kinase